MGNFLSSKINAKNGKRLALLFVFMFVARISLRKVLLVLREKKYREIVNAIHEKRKNHIDEFFRNNKHVGQGLKSRILGCHSLEKLQGSVKAGHFSYEEIFLTIAERACSTGLNCNLIGDVNLNEGLATARYCDQRLRDYPEEKHSLFFGIPVSVKDHIQVHGLGSSQGTTNVYLKSKNLEDSWVVSALREKGAIFYIKTNIPQNLFYVESFNPLWGRSLNPWDRTRTTAGSSGGEGGLIACGGSIIGIGSDALGSIVMPASFCGIYGFKPTARRSSLHGVLSLDGCYRRMIKEVSPALGPMGRCVDDLIAFCEETFSAASKFDTHSPPLGLNKKLLQSTRKLKVGYCSSVSLIESFPAVKNTVEEVKSKLSEDGHSVEVFSFDKYTEAYYSLCNLLFSSVNAERLKDSINGEEIEYPNKMTFFMLSRCNLFVKFLSSLAALFGEARFSKLVKIFAKPSYKNAVQTMHALDKFRSDFYEEMRMKELDCIILPTMPFPAVPHDTACFVSLGLFYTVLVAILGLPSGFVPVRKVKAEEQFYNSKCDDIYSKAMKKMAEKSAGLPVGVYVVSLPYKDEVCLSAMKTIESIFQFHEAAE